MDQNDYYDDEEESDDDYNQNQFINLSNQAEYDALTRHGLNADIIRKARLSDEQQRKAMARQVQRVDSSLTQELAYGITQAVTNESGVQPDEAKILSQHFKDMENKNIKINRRKLPNKPVTPPKYGDDPLGGIVNIVPQVKIVVMNSHADDAKNKEKQKRLKQQQQIKSRLRHVNIDRGEMPGAVPILDQNVVPNNRTADMERTLPIPFQYSAS